MADGEFDEEEIWGSFGNEKDFRTSPTKSTKKHKNKGVIISSPSSSNTSSPKTIRKPNGMSKTMRQSAPVNIPDWSKIYQNKNYSTPACDDDGADDDSVEEEGSDERVPPHEWLARKMARSNISSFSVCEGAGRTLKGRDLSRVRRAVLTKTGFLE
ncbi:protein S40-7-like [Carex rostrata]